MIPDTQYLTVIEIGKYLGLGRNRVLRLCQERTHNFPAVKVGNRYQAELGRLSKWRDDWFDGKFGIDN